MAIKIGNAATDYVEFSGGSYVYGLTQKSIDTVIYYTGTANAFYVALSSFSAPSTNEAWYVVILSNGKVEFGQYFSGGTPNYSYWDGNTVLSTGFHRIGITYDKSNSANDPLMWVDNVSQTITLGFRNTGSAVSGSSNPMRLIVGGVGTGHELLALNIYKHILSSAEIGDANNSRLLTPNYNGLVFAPVLYGASGLQTFDNTTLTSSNKVTDYISGVQGTPAGSPVGVADNYLAIR